MYMSRYLAIFAIAILLPLVSGRCSYTWKKKVVDIICSDIDQDKYLSEMFKIRTNLTYSTEDKNFTKISINIANSNFSTIDEYIYLPWDNLLGSINILKIVNSSVNNVKTLYGFQLLETLDLSGNNISDYNFLGKLKKLRYLHLSHSIFVNDSIDFTYLQRYHNRIISVDLKMCNLHEFNLVANQIETYDLSDNPNLQSINFNTSLNIRFLNLSGNSQLKQFKKIGKTDFLCVSSIDLSNFNNSFNFLLLKDIRVSEKISMRNNIIETLNKSVYALDNLISKTCSKTKDISIDLSNTKLKLISPKYFSDHVFNLINLSYNNLVTLEGPIFSRSTFLILDLSHSNVSSIGKNVFNYVIVTLLNLSNNNITSLEEVFHNIEEIKKIDLSSNPIQTLTKNTFKNCQKLETLNLTNTFVGSFEENTFLNLISLRKLSLSFVDSVEISAIKNWHVTELTIRNSSLISLKTENFKEFYKLNKLSFIDSSVNNVSNLAFKGLNMLKIIDLSGLNRPGNDITIFKYLHNLRRLDLSNHNIKDNFLDFEGLYSLKHLNLSSNLIADIEVNLFNSLEKLEVLSLADNQLSSLALGTFLNLKKLTHLYLNQNRLQKLIPGIFSGLNNLILLDISHNQLLRTKPHIFLSGSLKSLKFLYLQHNQLGNEYAKGDDTVRRYEFETIANSISPEFIDINENQWSCATLINVLASFRNKNIGYLPLKPTYSQENINGISCTT